MTSAGWHAPRAGLRATRARAYEQDGEHRVDATVLVQRQQAIRRLAPVIGPGFAFDGMRFYDRRDNSARMSLGLGVALVGVLIALWWTTGVQVDLSVLRGPAAFLNYRDLDRPTTRPGALSVAPSTTMAPEVQAIAVAVPPKDSLPVPTAVVPGSAVQRMRIAGTDGLGVALRNPAHLDAREPRGLLEGALVTVLERQGTDWVRVRDDGGQEGWVPAQYLLPA
jgi:Bacterial SH3 domain